MDPNEALRISRMLVREAHASFTSHLEDEEIARLVEAFDALDQWLTNGGFLPAAWDQASRSPVAFT